MLRQKGYGGNHLESASGHLRYNLFTVIRFSMNPLGLHSNPTRESCRPWQC